MIALLGSALQMTVPSPLTRRREYEAYMRAPAIAPLPRLGTLNAWRYGSQYFGRIRDFPEPQDAFAGDSGIQESGQVTVAITNPDAPAI